MEIPTPDQRRLYLPKETILREKLQNDSRRNQYPQPSRLRRPEWHHRKIRALTKAKRKKRLHNWQPKGD